MADSRSAVLSAIQDALVYSQPPAEHISAPNLPANNWPSEHCIKEFYERAARANTTIVQLDSIQQAPTYIQQQLTIETTLVHNDIELFNNLAWDAAPHITLSTNIIASNEKASLTHASAAIAETGTLVVTSSRETPTSLHFLPQIEFCCLHADDIKGSYEQAWQYVNQGNMIPRCINFITGPSCTGDIEQEILWGAHGPKQLHILIYTT